MNYFKKYNNSWILITIKNFSGSYLSESKFFDRSILAHDKNILIDSDAHQCFVINENFMNDVKCLTDRFVKYLMDITNEPIRIEIRIDINRRSVCNLRTGLLIDK